VREIGSYDLRTDRDPDGRDLDGYRLPRSIPARFTVDRAKFPDLKKLNTDLNAEGIRLVAITDLHIAYAPEPRGNAPLESRPCRAPFRAQGRRLALTSRPVWPGPAVFPDIHAHTASRDWWGSLYKDFIADGLRRLLERMNEPAVCSRPPPRPLPLD